ncbi:urease accessory protein UreF [Halocynthiibacter sp. C4]|uniref:urease accessory protein UreF n=1 Tax=Halocynthiibacter sp. C4 TaxID=2992758 RepID=UPI00237A52C3|nr:urease accessory UreF family protein [Halocynthiibacter sp. C4]MDE0589308.1 urease accessory protein UreF [Halocynthiibacter sp. C4]
MTADLLSLTQWLSPAFPLGSFAYSHGLETAVVQGDVRTASELERWINDVLQHGAGRVDAILLCQSFKGAEVADLACALAASKERLEESEAQGRAFVETVNAITGSELAAAPLPVAVGIALRSLSLGAVEVASLYLHAFASNLVSVGVRFIPLGQTEGQQVLSALHATITDIATAASTAALDDIASAAFGADMAAMQHETQDVRIFKT